MSDLELLRSLALDPVAPDDWARAEARGRLLGRARRSPQRAGARRLRVLAPAAVLAASLVVVAGAGVIGGGDETASAAPVLRQAAAVARARDVPTAGPGEFVYTRSETAYTSTWVLRPDLSFTVLVPRVRETWLGAKGGRLVERSGTPRFLSERDRRAWIEAGRPSLAEPARTTTLAAAQPLALPADADQLYERLENEARGHSEGTHAQMFTLVGDALRETNASASQRAALYEVAARLPGVELVGEVTDPAGRPGLAVAYTTEQDELRHMLVFDPDTSVLLAEEQISTGGRYPAGTRLGYALYLDQGVVGSPGEQPKR